MADEATHDMTLLADGAAALAIPLNAEQLAQFHSYYRELSAWNNSINLTSITGSDATQARHFLDSLTVCLPMGHGTFGPAGRIPDGARVIDIGSGAGFPGLPLKLAFPSIELHLVESVGKKASFLRHLERVLGLQGVFVHNKRAEALAREDGFREAFDLALVRGVARLSLLLEYALPFCRHPGGQTVALKHDGGLEAELADAAGALSELGGRAAGVWPVTLPALADNRAVVLFDKVAPTPERYPRRVGIPAKRPL